jgi:hypothetical protein
MLDVIQFKKASKGEFFAWQFQSQQMIKLLFSKIFSLSCRQNLAHPFLEVTMDHIKVSIQLKLDNSAFIQVRLLILLCKVWSVKMANRYFGRGSQSKNALIIKV